MVSKEKGHDTKSSNLAREQKGRATKSKRAKGLKNKLQYKQKDCNYFLFSKKARNNLQCKSYIKMAQGMASKHRSNKKNMTTNQKCTLT